VEEFDLLRERTPGETAALLGYCVSVGVADAAC
jgi:hypothetical protein